MNYEPVIGFEVHIELGTRSKMFCGCPADHFGRPPNSQTCPVCLGLPGALPVPNATAIQWCIQLGLALNCQVNLHSKFDRKNYFYPDLPKGYQISQYDQPFCHSGFLELPSGMTIRITRVHMEEDTGKLQHATLDGQSVSLIDFNRSGVPLVEIVTEPDFTSADQATEFLKEVQLIIRTLNISSADMEKGSMRLEANISVRPSGRTELPDYKVEVKNVNSFRFIKKAIEYEIIRQTEVLASGTTPHQETRGFKEATGETVSQRRKEQAHDYRYFPEPDIPPFEFTADQIEDWRTSLPQLPQTKRAGLQGLGLSAANAATIVSTPARYQKFIQLADTADPLVVANAIINTPEDKLSALTLTQTPVNTDEQQIRSEAAKIISASPKAVADIKSGKQQAMFYIIGQIKRTLGDVDIPLTQKIISAIIDSLA